MESMYEDVLKVNEIDEELLDIFLAAVEELEG